MRGDGAGGCCENRGWRRSRLGGGSGSHFYAWWAPAGAALLKKSEGFEGRLEAVFLRDIRHHDDHAALDPGYLATDYLPLSVPELRDGEFAPAPWTQPQLRFARLAESQTRRCWSTKGIGCTATAQHVYHQRRISPLFSQNFRTKAALRPPRHRGNSNPFHPCARSWQPLLRRDPLTLRCLLAPPPLRPWATQSIRAT